jgi:large subunit ribosomal protein L31
MKASIHPQYFTDTTVVCSCGNTFITGSTKDRITVEICSKCHPFYTGEQKFVDARGNVDKFMKRTEEAKKYRDILSAKKKKRNTKEERSTKSLRELLGEV